MLRSKHFQRPLDNAVKSYVLMSNQFVSETIDLFIEMWVYSHSCVRRHWSNKRLATLRKVMCMLY